jgi:hypothetical protein
MNGSRKLETIFPNLNSENYRITSPPDINYNCVGWAFEEMDRCWWPEPSEQYYWPEEIEMAETMDAFVAVCRRSGYELCETSEFETGYERLAIYAGTDQVPTHLARQLPNGSWTSKIGDLEDIQHRLKGLEGLNSRYGRVVRIVRRPKG